MVDKTIIEQLKNNIAGILLRSLNIKDKEIYILYIPQITNRDSLSENIIKPLLQYKGEESPTADLIISSIIYIDDVSLEEDLNKITDYIIEGKSVIIIRDSAQYIVANTVKYEKRSIESPEVQSAITSPRDAFNEDIDSNISLIRHRIKDSALKIDSCTVGIRTKTTVAVIYLKDVADTDSVARVKKRLQEINVDGILESGYIQKFLISKNTNLFPQVGISERSDKACADILDGRICILVDGSNLALIIPKAFIDFLDAGDDHYANTYVGMFLKVLRMVAVLITLTLSSFYVILVAYNPEFLPEQYILVLSSSRVKVPVNALLEAIFTELLTELLREANVRTPKQISTSISIVGAIVIGQALVAAGVVSPLMIIISSLSSITSYTVTDYTAILPIRLLKFLMLFLSGTFGLLGFIMGLNIIMTKIASTTSLGIPYTATLAPFRLKDLKNYLLSNVALSEERSDILTPKDKKRQ